MRTDSTLAIVPFGTFNNLALSLKLPLDPEAVCDLIEAGLTRRIDVGMADEQHAFFEAAGVGVDADLFPIGEEVKAADSTASDGPSGWRSCTGRRPWTCDSIAQSRRPTRIRSEEPSL